MRANGKAMSPPEIDSLMVNRSRFARSHLFVKKSGGGEGVPSDGTGSHLTGFRAACVGSGLAGTVVDFLPGDCLLVDFAARSDSLVGRGSASG